MKEDYQSLPHEFVITSQLNDLPPVGLLAQSLVRCTRIAEVKGANPVQAWILSGFLIATANVTSITAMSFFYLLFLTAIWKYGSFEKLIFFLADCNWGLKGKMDCKLISIWNRIPHIDCKLADD